MIINSLKACLFANRSTGGSLGEMSLVLSDTGRIETQQGEDGERFLILRDGVRYDLDSRSARNAKNRV